VTASASWRSKHTVIYLATALAVVFADLFGTDVTTRRIQIVLLVLSVAVLGVPHGALDPLIASAAGMTRNRPQMVRLLGIYVLQAAAMLAAWYLFPVLAFAVFLVISMHHFSGDWEEQAPVWQRWAAAASVLGAPALCRSEETAEILAMLLPGDAVPGIMPVLQMLASASIVVLVLGILQAHWRAWPSTVEMASIPILAWALPPLVFFVVYFCGLHSPRHVLETTAVLNMRPRVVLAVSAGITIVTLGICLGAFFLLPYRSVDAKLVQIVFIGLAALTVPHMALMERVRRLRTAESAA
jgi:Brp/Blh family beta-carotene 15,15'-monooxygenase